MADGPPTDPPAEHPVVWHAPRDGSTNVERFMAAHGIAGFDELVDRSIADPAWFWDAVAGFLGLPFERPYDQVIDTSGRHPLGHLVHRGHHERRGRVRRPVVGRHARRASRSCGRARTARSAS